MMPNSESESPRSFRIDGRKIKSVKDFYREIGRSVNGSGGYFGQNLDALADCLRGGFGTPADRPYEFVWQHSEFSRHELQGERRGQGSFFDAVLDVFEDAGVTLKLR
jgi:RNAse (barnase) inhibitor barstar